MVFKIKKESFVHKEVFVLVFIYRPKRLIKIVFVVVVVVVVADDDDDVLLLCALDPIIWADDYMEKCNVLEN